MGDKRKLKKKAPAYVAIELPSGCQDSSKQTKTAGDDGPPPEATEAKDSGLLERAESGDLLMQFNGDIRNKLIDLMDIIMTSEIRDGGDDEDALRHRVGHRVASYVQIKARQSDVSEDEMRSALDWPLDEFERLSEKLADKALVYSKLDSLLRQRISSLGGRESDHSSAAGA
ncbi:hypothetical protein CDD83_5026 [Cordyceps sp. RAO-2017]|nr:hypothetical protein CDD83_5026 [Cordyceps sp. RAO-2017]